MSYDIKDNYLMQIFKQETNTQYTLNQKQIKLLSKELAMMNTLENNDVLTDSILDHKIFFGNYSTHDEFFSAMKYVTME